MTLPMVFFLSLLFSRLMQPLSSGLILLAQTILISISSGLMNKTFWFSYILFLIFLGGMLVLFIYVASLASNEQFKVSFSFFTFSLIGSLILMGFLLVVDPMIFLSKLSIPVSQASFMDKSSISATSVSSIYNIPSYSFTVYLISYLLLALIVVVKIMHSFSSPLRLTN